jgi:HPt (histidine-containing phosphotransfer) domain-containing protein
MPMSAAAMLEEEIGPVAGAQVPVIDLVHLSRQTLGDNALESELLRLFIVQTQQYASWLKEPPVSDDVAKRADLTHRLKGSARAVGAFPLAEAAEIYEEALRAGAKDTTIEAGRLAEALENARLAATQLL